MATKTTNELKAGDVILWADYEDTVTDILVDGSQVAQVTVNRLIDGQRVNAWFFSGINAVHTVKETS